MLTFDSQAYRNAYEQMAAGDLDAISGHLAPDYTLHLVGRACALAVATRLWR